MKRTIAQFIREHFLVLMIALIAVFLSWANYTPGSFLTGWDTLHPEFNFPLNFQRLIFGVWREDQGLGAVAGHSHMSELPRIIFLWLSSFVFPVSFLRYLYVFLCLILGPIGVYFFLEKIVFSHREKPVKKTMSFLGGIFYLLNLGTLQHFYVPFEMFMTQYAALGWLFLFALRYLKDKGKKDLLFFTLVTFLAAPQAYAATLFYAYFLVLIIFLITLSLPQIYIRNFSFLKRPFALIFLTLAINSFWLLPNLYFVKNYGGKVADAKVNQLFSDEVFLKNKKFGTLEDTSIIKGYLFNWQKKEGDNTVMLFDKWTDYQNKIPFVLVIGYTAFIVILFGISGSFYKVNKYGLYFLPVFLIPFFFLTGMNSYSSIYTFIQNHFAVFKEAMRMPFTKFSVLLMFAFSVYFSLGNLYIYEMFKKKFSKIYLIQLFIWGIFLVIYMFPAFRGELIAPEMRIRIPKEYFSAFDWFNNQKDTGRIANFPSSSYAGWEIYRWGYQGAGFFWFGEKMPFLARDFDRWISYNENYYHEMSYALYSKNKEIFQGLLNKYQIGYLFIDENVESRTTNKDALYLSELKNMVKAMPNINLKARYGNISIYKAETPEKPNNFIFTADKMPVIEPAYNWNNLDKGYSDYRDNISYLNNNLLPDVYYPFRSLFTGKKQNQIEFKIEDKGSFFLLTGKIPKQLAGYDLILPKISLETVSEMNTIDYSLSRPLYPRVYLDGELISYNPTLDLSTVSLKYIKDGNLEVIIPKINGFYSYDNINSPISPQTVDEDCDEFSNGKSSAETKNEYNKRLLRMVSEDGSNCLDSPVENLTQKFGYIISLESRNVSGKSLNFSIINKTSKKSDFEFYLQEEKNLNNSYYLIPPMEEYGLGYSLYFKNTSFDGDRTINDIGRITVNPIPYSFLTSMKVIKPNYNSQTRTNALQLLSVNHPNPSLYLINIDNETMKQLNNGTIILSQSYDPGWRAYNILNTRYQILNTLFPFWFGKKIDDHVLVNNWENGWKLTTNNLQPTTIVIVYLPQYLEYFGLFILMGTLLTSIFLIFYDKEKGRVKS